MNRNCHFFFCSNDTITSTIYNVNRDLWIIISFYCGLNAHNWSSRSSCRVPYIWKTKNNLMPYHIRKMQIDKVTTAASYSITYPNNTTVSFTDCNFECGNRDAQTISNVSFTFTSLATTIQLDVGAITKSSQISVDSINNNNNNNHWHGFICTELNMSLELFPGVEFTAINEWVLCQDVFSFLIFRRGEWLWLIVELNNHTKMWWTGWTFYNVVSHVPCM